MELPKIVTPTYELVLPSDGRKIKYRPFLVQEEKIFLLTLEGLSKDEKDKAKNERSIIDTIQQIAENCIIAPKLDVSKLPLFDIQYIFVQLRSKSQNDKLDLYFNGRSGDDVKCEECKKQKHIVVDLNTIEVKKEKKHTNKIKVTDKIGVIMRYPSFSTFTESGSDNTVTDLAFDSIVSCIESIYDESNVYEAKDFTKEQLIAFLSQFSSSQFNKLQEFLDTMPKLFHRIEWQCKSCGFKQHYDMEKTEDFFG